MTPEDLLAENERLRAEVDSHRQRERAALEAALADARAAAEHYRREAERNAEIGRQIDREYRKQVEELRAKLATYQNPMHARQTHVARN